MPDLRSVILPHLEANQLPGLGLKSRTPFIYPSYQGYSLTNVPASLCHWLGVPSFGMPPFATDILDLWRGSFQHIVLLLVDALSLSFMESLITDPTDSIDHPGLWARMIHGQFNNPASLAPITSIVPSTTSAALATLWTGQPPARHGIMGYEVWLKEYSLIANMIFHSPTAFNMDIGGLRRAGFQPETFLPLPTLGVHLAQHGIRCYAFQHQAISRSGISTMLLPGVENSPFRTTADLWVSVSQLMESRPHDKNFIYIYWGDVDELSHRFGPQDQRVRLEFASFSRMLDHLLSDLDKRGKRDTLFLVLADHGQIATPRRAEYDLRNYPRLLSCLTMSPSGENRLPYIYVRAGKEKELQRMIQDFWQGQYQVIPSEQALESGLFGENGRYAKVNDRVGDYVVFPEGDSYWWWADKENPLSGRHGGLTPEEMLVPLLGMVI